MASENALALHSSAAGAYTPWHCIFLSIYPKFEVSGDHTCVRDVIIVFLKVHSEKPTKWCIAQFQNSNNFEKKETINEWGLSVTTLASLPPLFSLYSIHTGLWLFPRHTQLVPRGLWTCFPLCLEYSAPQTCPRFAALSLPSGLYLNVTLLPWTNTCKLHPCHHHQFMLPDSLCLPPHPHTPQRTRILSKHTGSQH